MEKYKLCVFVFWIYSL